MKRLYEGELTIELSKMIDVPAVDDTESLSDKTEHEEHVFLQEIIEFIENRGYKCHDNNLTLNSKQNVKIYSVTMV